MEFFFDSWDKMLQIFLTVILSYPMIVFALRLFGKRSLAKMNMFDFIVTVALGSLLATTIVSEDVSVIEGVFAFVLILSAQYIVTWTSSKWTRADKLVKAEPTILFHDGNYLDDVLKRERVSHGEILAAIRQNGFSALSEVYAVILETNGKMSVLKRNQSIDQATFSDVENFQKVT